MSHSMSSMAAIATPSPSAQQQHQSPVTNQAMLGQSPVATRMQSVPSGGAGPGIAQAGTPQPPRTPAQQPQTLGSLFGGDPNKLIANMPELLKARQAGQMNPEMQKNVSC